MNTDYGLREPSFDELRNVFGSVSRAYQITGGSVPTVCFYVNNPRLIESAADVAPAPASRYGSEMRAEADREEVVAAWDAQQAKRKSITEAARVTAHGFQYTKRVLVESGRLAA